MMILLLNYASYARNFKWIQSISENQNMISISILETYDEYHSHYIERMALLLRRLHLGAKELIYITYQHFICRVMHPLCFTHQVSSSLFYSLCIFYIIIYSIQVLEDIMRAEYVAHPFSFYLRAQLLPTKHECRFVNWQMNIDNSHDLVGID